MDFSPGNLYGPKRSNHDDITTLPKEYNFYDSDDDNGDNSKEVFVMKIFIIGVSNIIRFNDSFPYSLDRIKYRVIVSDENGREFSTRKRIGMPTPEWNEEIDIYFNSYPIDQYLKLMVVRENCYNNDPGTSTGEVVVGRAKIKIPVLLNTKKDSVVELVKLVGVEKKLDALISFQTLLTKEDITSL